MLLVLVLLGQFVTSKEPHGVYLLDNYMTSYVHSHAHHMIKRTPAFSLIHIHIHTWPIETSPHAYMHTYLYDSGSRCMALSICFSALANSSHEADERPGGTVLH